MRRPVRDPLHQPLLDLRQRTLRNEQLRIAPPQQAVHDRIDDERADLQTKLPVKLLGLEQIEAGWVGQRMDELAVGKLLDVRYRDFNDGAEIPGDGRPEIPAETFVQRFERPHLVFADSLGPFEIVNLHFQLCFPLRPEDGRGRVLLPGRAGIHRRQKRIDFGLI